jgi:hypothetical protein
MAVELDAEITADDFRTLNRCLDDAIANAVSEYSRQERRIGTPEHSMTLHNLITTAMNGLEVLRTGDVGISGATGDLVFRCLVTMRDLVSEQTSRP